MNNIFNIIKDMYRKEPIEVSIDTGECILLTKYLSLDRANLPRIKQIVNYLFYIEPRHYFYLLFLRLPQSLRVPFLKWIPKQKQEINMVHKKVQYLLNWSNRELELHLPILDKILTKNVISTIGETDGWKNGEK